MKQPAAAVAPSDFLFVRCASLLRPVSVVLVFATVR